MLSKKGLDAVASEELEYIALDLEDDDDGSDDGQDGEDGKDDEYCDDDDNNDSGDGGDGGDDGNGNEAAKSSHVGEDGRLDNGCDEKDVSKSFTCFSIGSNDINITINDNFEGSDNIDITVADDFEDAAAEKVSTKSALKELRKEGEWKCLAVLAQLLKGFKEYTNFAQAGISWATIGNTILKYNVIMEVLEKFMFIKTSNGKNVLDPKKKAEMPDLIMGAVAAYRKLRIHTTNQSMLPASAPLDPNMRLIMLAMEPEEPKDELEDFATAKPSASYQIIQIEFGLIRIRFE
ncbi:hypothetical protein BG005_003382 [Podila minutissima]|nr:hypothetical protein BG005_003382 [Podila minutissima]